MGPDRHGRRRAVETLIIQAAVAVGTPGMYNARMARTWTPNLMRWNIADPPEAAGEVAAMMQLSTLLVTLLHQRDICEPDAIDAFLDPKLTGLQASHVRS